ncbi:putative plastid-lipid-associated protein 12, chloroplastic [Cocos nucifera]|nr:putative plastid-lipid-associated protein 12, chloroplastic [Cocos nucifera]
MSAQGSQAAAAIKDGRRILFQFDRAAFSFKFLPFKVPYPVPFRLLGDEAKGWLDTTYLSHNGNVRVSRGNKGTTFVLQKETEPRQRLLSAISSGTGVMEVINELVSLNQKEAIDESETIEGEWQLLWASQMKNESWKSIAANGLKGLQIITADGQLENLVDTFPGFKISANGNLT